MREVSRDFLEFARKHNLLYDGNKGIPSNLNKLVNPYLGRTYKVTKHKIFFTTGSKGIYDIVIRIQERDRTNKRYKEEQAKLRANRINNGKR